MSEGGEVRGSWNSDENFDYVADPQPAVDGGDGPASVMLSKGEKADLESMALRTSSNPDVNPMTGAELGSQAVPAELQKEKKIIRWAADWRPAFTLSERWLYPSFATLSVTL